MPQELSLETLVVRCEHLMAAGHRRLIGITGAPGAGKSTLSDALQKTLGARAVIVAMDGFHLAQQELVRLGRAERKGAPDTFDVAGYVALLSRLGSNRDPVIYAPLFRRDLEEPVGSCVPVGVEVSLVITEGNYLLLEDGGWQGVRPQLDEVWYLEVPDEVRIPRLIDRHRSFGKDPLAAREWAIGSDQRNAALIEGSKDRADLIFRLAAL